METKTKSDFKAVDFMRKVCNELSDLYHDDRERFHKELKKSPLAQFFRQDDLMSIKLAGLCPEFEKQMLNKFAEDKFSPLAISAVTKHTCRRCAFPPTPKARQALPCSSGTFYG